MNACMPTVGSNVRVNDSGIWNKTTLLEGIQNGSVELPNDRKLRNGENDPYVFLGDDAFSLKRYNDETFPSTGFK